MRGEHIRSGVGRLLATYREKRDWLQADVAERCGWAQSKVSRLETGAAQPRLDDLEKLAALYDVPIGRLLAARKKAA